MRSSSEPPDSNTIPSAVNVTRTTRYMMDSLPSVKSCRTLRQAETHRPSLPTDSSAVAGKKKSPFRTKPQQCSDLNGRRCSVHSEGRTEYSSLYSTRICELMAHSSTPIAKFDLEANVQPTAKSDSNSDAEIEADSSEFAMTKGECELGF